jgi:hypothetical protein
VNCQNSEAKGQISRSDPLFGSSALLLMTWCNCQCVHLLLLYITQKQCGRKEDSQHEFLYSFLLKKCTENCGAWTWEGEITPCDSMPKSWASNGFSITGRLNSFYLHQVAEFSFPKASASATWDNLMGENNWGFHGASRTSKWEQQFRIWWTL